MGAVDLVSDILSLVDNIFNFLSCETDVEESTVTEWSILDGQSTLGLGDIQSIIDRARGLASNITATRIITYPDYVCHLYSVPAYALPPSSFELS